MKHLRSVSRRPGRAAITSSDLTTLSSLCTLLSGITTSFAEFFTDKGDTSKSS